MGFFSKCFVANWCPPLKSFNRELSKEGNSQGELLRCPCLSWQLGRKNAEMGIVDYLAEEAFLASAEHRVKAIAERHAAEQQEQVMSKPEPVKEKPQALTAENLSKHEEMS